MVVCHDPFSKLGIIQLLFYSVSFFSIKIISFSFQTYKIWKKCWIIVKYGAIPLLCKQISLSLQTKPKSKTKISFEKWQTRKNNNAFLRREARREEYAKRNEELEMERKAIKTKRNRGPNKKSHTSPDQQTRITSCMLRLAGMPEMNVSVTIVLKFKILCTLENWQIVIKNEMCCEFFTRNMVKHWKLITLVLIIWQDSLIIALGLSSKCEFLVLLQKHTNYAFY